MYINDPKLKKYQKLFFQAGLVAGRVLAGKTRKDRIQGTVESAVNYYLKEWYSIPELVNREYCPKFNPIATLLDKLVNSNDEVFEIIQRFFYDTVYDIAVIENTQIDYHELYASEDSLYGIAIRDYERINYPKYLRDQGYDLEDIFVEVKSDDYIYIGVN